MEKGGRRQEERNVESLEDLVQMFQQEEEALETGERKYFSSKEKMKLDLFGHC